jgi:hypothetical protein
MMSWSVSRSYVPHTFDQSGANEQRFLRLQNDRRLAGEQSASFTPRHDISPSARKESASFSKINIAKSGSLSELFFAKCATSYS